MRGLDATNRHFEHDENQTVFSLAKVTRSNFKGGYMKKVEIKKLAGAGVLSVGLVFGMTGFAGATSGTIDTTGPESNNQIRHKSRVEIDVENDNDVELNNRNEQRASSGDARVRYNTTGGSAMAGSVANESMVDAWVEIDNSQAVADLGAVVDAGAMGSDSALIENTGPLSNNEVNFENTVEVDVENDNNVNINNSVEQTARSGDASVQYNTTGGNAVSGNVSNTSESVLTVSISN